MPHLGMELLGGFRVTLDGAPLTTFESNKVRALLAYLAVELQRPHPRESLAALLWPDWPDRAALSNLRYALSDLRKVSGDRGADPPFLLISREAIQFNAESDHALDVAEFTRLADGQDVEQMEQAIALYKGEFLEGFSVGDAAPFEGWARLKREQFHRAFLDTLHRLAAALERCGEFGHALPYAWRQVEVEPLDESAQRQLMRLLALSGRRGEALARYEACRGVLEKRAADCAFSRDGRPLPDPAQRRAASNCGRHPALPTRLQAGGGVPLPRPGGFPRAGCEILLRAGGIHPPA